MTNRNETLSAEILTPEQFLAKFEATRECFPLAGGTFARRGETETVRVADYHAPTSDFFGDDKLREHIKRGGEARTIEIPLEISPDFEYGFDPGEEWFRVGSGAFIHISGQRIPVRVVRLDFVGFSVAWLYRDEHDQE